MYVIFNDQIEPTVKNLKIYFIDTDSFVLSFTSGSVDKNNSLI